MTTSSGPKTQFYERPLKLISAVLFDIGHVVVKLKTKDFLERVALACPQLDAATMLRELRDPDTAHIAYEKGQMDGPSFHSHLVKQFGLSWGYDEWLNQWNNYFEPNRPMDVLVAKLVLAKVRLWALSNTNTEHLAHVRRTFRIFDVFEGFTASHLEGLRKPDPEIYHRAAKALHLPPAEIVYLDDVAANAQAATDIGMHGFHYTYNDLEFKSFLEGLGLKLQAVEHRAGYLGC